jgi:hypothetical protein
MTYQFENLNPERFQQLCQALIARAFPGVQCFPVGQPDGGRDAIIRLAGDAKEFIVFQVKFVRDENNVADAREWLLEIAAAEAKKAAALVKDGAVRYILATNVPGTAHYKFGSIDKMNAELTNAIGVTAECWWRDDLSRQLDSSLALKLKYAEILSGDDALTLLAAAHSSHDYSRQLNAIRAFMASQYDEDVEVKFKQIELHNKLLDLFIDLPFTITIPGTANSDLAPKILRLEERLRVEPRYRSMYDPRSPKIPLVQVTGVDDFGVASLLLSDAVTNEIGHAVMEGAPGQGKSTIAQYVCQIHRIRWLNKVDDLKRFPAHHKNSALKIPIKVDLRDLAEWLDSEDATAPGSASTDTRHPRTLQTFLADLINRESGGGYSFTVNDLIELAKTAPLLIVLDALDEVPDVRRRGEVVNAVTKSCTRLRANCPDLFVLITSRPAAFANSPGFDRQQFTHLRLDDVTRKQIDVYADNWMRARTYSNRDEEELRRILSAKIEEPHLRDLARNPMQLAILLSLIHTHGPALPDKRTALYDDYVDLFFNLT